MVSKEARQVAEKFKKILTGENHKSLSATEWEEILRRELSNSLYSKTLFHPPPYTLYRARLNPQTGSPEANFQNSKELLASPQNLCQQGRCNKKGDSLLYCSTKPSIIIYELKPAIGDEFTIIEYDCRKGLGPLCMVGIKEIYDEH